MSEWQLFANYLAAENAALGELGTAALRLGDALIANEPAAIDDAERMLESRRLLHASAFTTRTGMQKRGFGPLTLEQVCSYAPPALRPRIGSDMHEMRTRTVALQLTVSNNKALILAGLERLARTVAVLQKAGTEQTGTYRRRGVVPPPDGSVIVSRRA